MEWDMSPPLYFRDTIETRDTLIDHFHSACTPSHAWVSCDKAQDFQTPTNETRAFSRPYRPHRLHPDSGQQQQPP
jgi:hypothetical protein